MSTIWIAILSGAVAAAVALVLTRIVSRGRRSTSAELQRALDASSAHFEARVAELTRELQRIQAESRRSRRFSAVATTIDLDEVLSRTLEAAAALSLVDAASVVVPQEGSERPLVATVGMSTEEAARYAVDRPAGGEAAAAKLSYGHEGEEAADEPDLIRRSLVVPLHGDSDDAIGSLAVFWREATREPAEEDIATLEDLAAVAGPAIENARRFRDARTLADLDDLTNLHNRRYFHETLGREVARAHRYDRRLALVVLDIDDFKSINDQVGHLAGDAVLSEFAERVLSVVRSADVACRVGGDEFAVILPESRLADAEHLYRRLQLSVTKRPIGPAHRLRLSAGIAELTPQDDRVSFFERTDEALYRAKETGKGQAVAG